MVNKMTVKNNMNEFYRGRKIFVTGHTGFIGSWLTKSLTLFNSEVCGFALETLSSPNLYEILDIRSAISDERGDIRARNLLKNVIQRFRPEIVFHLAAQPIVLE